MANQETKSPIGYILLGVSIGATIGGGTVGLIAHSKLKKSRLALEEARKAKKRAYLRGVDDATEDAQRWISQHVKIIDANDPESAQKAISEAFNNLPDDNSPEDPAKLPSDILPSPEPQQKTPVISQEAPTLNSTIAYADDIYAEDPEKPKEDTVGPDEIGFRCGDQLLKYPRKLFFDEAGESLGELKVRENLRVYESDKSRLNLVWQALGYGEYFPDEPENVDLEDWDLNIEGDEPEEKTKERERYLEEVKRYNDNPNEGPRIVSKKEFDEENFLEHANIYYYAGDNVFVDSTDMDNPIDAVMLLGVSDGQYLFANKPMFDPEDDDNDPDIVYVRNFKMNTIAEVTRFKTAYAAVADGSVYLDGAADQSGGA